MMSGKSRTVGRSIRLDEQWLNVLNEEAKNEGISQNALLNRILQDYCLFYRHVKRYPAIILTQKSFGSIIAACPQEQIRLCGKRTGSVNAQDLINTLGLSMDHENIIYLLKQVYGHYGNWYNYNHHVQNGKEVFHLRHNLGENWSIFLSEVVTTLFQDSLNKKVKKTFQDNTVTVEVPL
jgi:hypothetical protein